MIELKWNTKFVRRKLAFAMNLTLIPTQIPYFNEINSYSESEYK